jgi:cysteine-rich repeat protein
VSLVIVVGVGCDDQKPECGDGKLREDNGEECDDGNIESGDWCDEACHKECGYMCWSEWNDGTVWSSGNGHCYWVVDGDWLFGNARSFCQLYDSHVVFISSEAEDTFSPWLGLNDEVLESVFEWADTTEIPVYSNWNEYGDEPNNSGSSGSNADCSKMALDGGDWFDENCGWGGAIICEHEY